MSAHGPAARAEIDGQIDVARPAPVKRGQSRSVDELALVCDNISNTIPVLHGLGVEMRMELPFSFSDSGFDSAVMSGAKLYPTPSRIVWNAESKWLLLD